MNTADWRSGADPQVLRLRAGLLSELRTFFAERDVMEVVTPALGGSGVTAVHIHNIAVE
ncbi:MAG: EF-P lysine aminoacylase GenX, partial [Pseudomonadales bacterium]|nr:EF-P lysine aminoacylase GenX [Pseudomonadales bacterium]